MQKIFFHNIDFLIITADIVGIDKNWSELLYAKRKIFITLFLRIKIDLA